MSKNPEDYIPVRIVANDSGKKLFVDSFGGGQPPAYHTGFKDANGIESYAKTDSDNRLELSCNPLNIASGDVTGVDIVEIFSQNSDVDVDGYEDIWDYGGTYTYPSSAVTMYTSSSNANDTQNIKVYGLDANWDLQEQTVTLQGQTKTAIAGTWIRIWRIKNIGSTDIAGNVYVYEDDTVTAGVPDTASKVKGMIIDGNNQSLMSHFTIPNGKNGFIARCYGGLAKKKDGLSNIRLFMREFGQVFQLKATVVASSTGNSFVSCDYPYYRTIYDHDSIPSKTDIKMAADSSVADAGISGGYTILLVDSS